MLDKRRYWKSGILVRQMSGNPTYQDLAAWSNEKFRVADNPTRMRNFVVANYVA
jgi:hypothetical protein